jgi:Photosynthesis system II assembly factor YCF48
MQTVPQIVRERLKAITPPGNHPEPAVLAAFAEYSLPSPERTVVLEHLSACADCREVVALALPELEVVAPVVVPARRPWLTWPALRWGFASAGVLAIFTFGVLQYRRHVQPATMVAKQISSPEADQFEAPAPAPPSAAAGAEKSDSSGARSAMHSPRKSNVESRSGSGDQIAAAPRRAVALPPSGATVAGAVGAPVVNHFAKPLPWPSQPHARPRQMLVAAPHQPSGTAATAIDNIASAPAPAQIDRSATRMQLQPSEPQSLAENDSLRIGKAKPADAPTWTISLTGVLERSFDQGTTWQDVDVTTASPQIANDLPIPDAASGTAGKKFNHRIAVKRQEPAPVFRAVTANGSDVWAGGVGGILYHSVDAGDRWTRVVPVSIAATLTGDIVSLEFSDTMHGRVVTSTAQVWTTTDGGQSWQQQ